MKISTLMQERLTRHLRTRSGLTRHQLVPDYDDIELTESLQQQFIQAQQLLNAQLKIINSRKAVNATIGKVRKAGSDATALIDESRQLSSEIQIADNEIDTLVQLIVDHYETRIATVQHCSSDCKASLTSATKDTDTEAAPQDTLDIPLCPDQFQPYSITNSLDVEQLCIRDDMGAGIWNDYVSKSLHATHYHQYEWRDLLIRNFNQRTHYLAACDTTGNIVGVTTAIFMRSAIVATSMLSTPFLIYGGPVADTSGVSDLLAERLASMAEEQGGICTQLRETQPRDGWTCSLDKVAMVLPLPSDVDTLNQGLGSRLRSQVKRARRENPTITIGGGELVGEFYKVFSRKMRDHGTPVYSRRFFDDIASTFADSTHIAVVRLGDRTVAAAFLIRFRETVEVPWAASLRKYDNLGMNMFMYHALLEDAVMRQYRFFDFGRSTRGGKTWRFKKQWGAKEQQLYWHSRPTRASGGQPDTSEDDTRGRMMQLAVQTWKHLPMPVANRLGPLLARQLPW